MEVGAIEGDSLGAGESVGRGSAVALGVGEASGDGAVLSEGNAVGDDDGSDVGCSNSSRLRIDGVALASSGEGEAMGSTSAGLEGGSDIPEGSTEGVGEDREPNRSASESASHKGGNSPELGGAALVAFCPSLNEAPETRADGVNTSALAAMTRIERRANPP